MTDAHSLVHEEGCIFDTLPRTAKYDCPEEHPTRSAHFAAENLRDVRWESAEELLARSTPHKGGMYAESRIGFGERSLH